LIATYHEILSLNVRTGQLSKLDADLGNLTHKAYVPTGIAVGHETGRVFVANYLANNILIGHIIGNRITFDQELTGDALVSPENVATTSDEQWLISANYDGSSATAFTLINGQYFQKWTTAIPQAHGVAILGDMVFVSSLLLKKIVVLDLFDGREIGSFGQPGWNTRCLDLLWPTNINVAEDSSVVITDAHTGAVYRIKFDGHEGKLQDVFGGTSPGPAGLQMPYAAIKVGANLAILWTFSPKVLIVGSSSSSSAPSIKTMIVQQSRQAERHPDREPSTPLGVGWNGYVHLAADPMTISGFLTVPAYGALMRVSRGRTLTTSGPLWLNTDSELVGSLMYFIEAHAGEKGVVLSSPSASRALYVTQGQASCFTRVGLPGAALAVDSGLDHRLGTTGYEEIESRALGPNCTHSIHAVGRTISCRCRRSLKSCSCRRRLFVARSGQTPVKTRLPR